MRVRGTGEGVKWEDSLADAWGHVRAGVGDEVVAASDEKFGKGGGRKAERRTSREWRAGGTQYRQAGRNEGRKVIQKCHMAPWLNLHLQIRRIE